MQRAVWSGVIQFGLINIPVKLYNAIKRKTIQFHQLRQKDGCRIRLRKVCASDGKEVSPENIVKGFEVSPDRYVVVTNEELKSLRPTASRSIEITEFVVPDEIDPIFLESPFYLLPNKGAGKSYALLQAALGKAGKAAIARFVLRNKEYLATLRPAGRILSLSTLHFSAEVNPQAEIEGLTAAEAEPSPRDLAMAEQLIAALSADFDPAKYHDNYRRKVMDLIEHKAAGEAIETQPAEAPAARVIDLTAALEASLAAFKPKPAPQGRKKARAQ